MTDGHIEKILFPLEHVDGKYYKRSSLTLDFFLLVRQSEEIEGNNNII